MDARVADAATPNDAAGPNAPPAGPTQDEAVAIVNALAFPAACPVAGCGVRPRSFVAFNFHTHSAHRRSVWSRAAGRRGQRERRERERAKADAAPPDHARGSVEAPPGPTPRAPHAPPTTTEDVIPTRSDAELTQAIERVARLPSAQYAVEFQALPHNMKNAVAVRRDQVLSAANGTPILPAAPTGAVLDGNMDPFAILGNMLNFRMKERAMRLLEAQAWGEMQRPNPGGETVTHDPKLEALERKLDEMTRAQERERDERRREEERRTFLEHSLKPIQDQLKTLETRLAGDPQATETVRALQDEIRNLREGQKEEKWASEVRGLRDLIGTMPKDTGNMDQFKLLTEMMGTMVRARSDGDSKFAEFMAKHVERQIEELRHHVMSEREGDDLERLERMAKFLRNHAAEGEPTTTDKVLAFGEKMIPQLKPVIEAGAQRIQQPGGAGHDEEMQVDCNYCHKRLDRKSVV